MYYDKIKVTDLQAMTVNNITPNYTVERYDFEIDESVEGKIHYAYGVNIIKTVEQVIQEQQEQQNQPNTPSTEDILLEYVADLDYRLSLKEMGL